MEISRKLFDKGDSHILIDTIWNMCAMMANRHNQRVKEGKGFW